MSLPLSVIIIARNEALRLPTCLGSLPVGAEIVLVDSESTDDTAEIAEKHGAQVVRRRFENFAAQKNAALGLATRDWVFSIDADEVMSAELREQVVEICQKVQPKAHAFSVKRRLVVGDRRLSWGGTEDWPLRFFKRESGRFEGDIHEKVRVSGQVSRVEACLWHHSYRDLADHVERLNLYTSLVAQRYHSEGKKPIAGAFVLMRFFVEFMVRYVFKLGFLDGVAGLNYALLSSVYTYLKYQKLAELQMSNDLTKDGA